MDNKNFKIELSADRDGLLKLYDFIADLKVYLDLDDKTHFDMELAMEEAITNIIHHAYGDAGGVVVVNVTVAEDEIAIIIQDWGKRFNLQEVPEFDLNEPVQKRINGGMGVHFIRSLMDRVEFDSSDTYGNVLTLIKKKRYQTQRPIRDELQVFEQVGRAIFTVRDVNTLLDLIVTRLTQVVDADRGTLYIVDHQKGELYSKILQESEEKLGEIRLKIGEGFAGQVAATGQLLNIRSVQNDPRFASRIDAASGYETRNMICTPMFNENNNVMGVIQLINKKNGHFTRRDEGILRVLASQAAIAIENARLFQAEKEKRQLADTLREVAAIINSPLDLEKVLLSILEQLERVIPFLNASILLIKDEYFVVSASRGVNADRLMRTPVFKVADSALYRDMLTHGDPMIVDDIQHDPRWIHIESTSGMHGWLGTILRVEDKDIGELTVIHNEPNYYTPEHADILAAFANQASAAIERARLYRQTIQQARLRQELETAYRIQTSFLPEKKPEVDGWEISASWNPAQEVGGDFYDFIELADGQIGFLIADVSGKGVPAALFMALARTIFRTLATDNLSVGTLITRVNDTIKEDNRARLFVTLFYGILNPTTGDFQYVNAGHNQPILVRACSGVGEMLNSSGPAIGVFSGVNYEEHVFRLDKDDVLVMYTDGITEAINVDEVEFDEERLIETINTSCNLSASAINTAILRDVETFAADTPPFDDSTIIVIKRTQGPLIMPS